MGSEALCGSCALRGCYIIVSLRYGNYIMALEVCFNSPLSHRKIEYQLGGDSDDKQQSSPESLGQWNFVTKLLLAVDWADVMSPADKVQSSARRIAALRAKHFNCGVLRDLTITKQRNYAGSTCGYGIVYGVYVVKGFKRESI